MARPVPLSCALLMALLFQFHLAPAPAHADLDSYLKKPEPAFRWEKRGEEQRPGCKVYDLRLVSQVWQGAPWEHRLQVFRPDNARYPAFCSLSNVGGGGSERATEEGVRIATATGAIHAVLHNIPNQPLYGKTEDALIVHTWLQYLKTGDESWPLHFPMAKAVLKAMDAIQAFSQEAGFPKVTGFLVYGGSKRGWTTWLAAASRDPRIKAIAPMVIDILNVRKQAPHQIASYGKPSEQVADYTEAGIHRLLETEGGRRLMDLVDPYSFRDRLTLPKLLVLGTNDRYWTQDALNLYWDDLKGPKWVLYVPNSGHSLDDRARVFATLTAFIRMNASGGRWPKPKWSYRDSQGGAELRLESDIPPKEARLFRATAKTRDFRQSRWESEAMPRTGSSFRARQPAPDEGYAAIFGEAVYEQDGRPFTLSTQIRILESKR